MYSRMVTPEWGGTSTHLSLSPAWNHRRKAPKEGELGIVNARFDGLISNGARISGAGSALMFIWSSVAFLQRRPLLISNGGVER